MTANYLESLLEELKGGSDLGVIILTVEDCKDGSEIEMYSNLTVEGVNEIMGRVVAVDIRPAVIH